MKKSMIVIGIVLVILVVGLIFMQNVNFNRLGANEYYTQINGEGTKIEEKGSGGTIFIRYEYELPAYDKDGNQKTFTFTAGKQLRENAYLLLFVKDGKGVTSYQEVTSDELPGKAVEMLD
ncbi:YxeA family protein [Peribacillus loiseleuriae]|uniref:Membrane protein n=1 Tax=Peribacillus loiseleuriae TaxID=1679170 RepID=A0A0K9GSV9_9BACI|nr:YxeA family protein [Peribacillus loiseleuriae]KMY49701.1 membrane protein [Peribacillus loiseleuriae]